MVRNKCVGLIRKDRKNAIMKSLNTATNPCKALWAHANRTFKPSRKEDLVVEDDGILVEDSDRVADIMNNFFVSKISGLRERVANMTVADPVAKIIQSGKTFPKFHLHPTSEEEVLSAIGRLSRKYSSGLDGFPPALLKDVGDIMCIPLTRIINRT